MFLSGPLYETIIFRTPIFGFKSCGHWNGCERSNYVVCAYSFFPCDDKPIGIILIGSILLTYGIMLSVSRSLMRSRNKALSICFHFYLFTLVLLIALLYWQASIHSPLNWSLFWFRNYQEILTLILINLSSGNDKKSRMLNLSFKLMICYYSH